MKLYPNPTRNTVTIEVGEEIADFGYTITNMVGQQVQYGNALNGETISVAELSKGMYFVNVQVEGLQAESVYLIIR